MIVADVDDLIHEDQITERLLPLREQVPGLRLTAYAPAGRLGSVHALRARYPWIEFGIHGWEHTFCEAWAWSVDQAEGFLKEALDLGYAPIFKGPNWACSVDIEQACQRLGIVLHHHPSYRPATVGLRCFGKAPGTGYYHTHMSPTPSTDWIETSPWFTVKVLQGNTFAWVSEAAKELRADAVMR